MDVSGGVGEDIYTAGEISQMVWKHGNLAKCLSEAVMQTNNTDFFFPSQNFEQFNS